MLYTAGGPPPSPVCVNADPMSGPRSQRDGGTPGEAPLGDRRAHLAHQPEVEVEIVQRREPGAEHLTRQHEMAERTPAEALAGVAAAARLHRTRITRVRGVANHQLALAGEERPVARVAGREDAVEKVISHGGEAKQIARRADAHQVAGPLAGQERDGLLRDAGRFRSRLSDREPADRVAIEAERREPRDTLRPELHAASTLHDPEKGRFR